MFRLIDDLISPEPIVRLRSRINPADGCDALIERQWRLSVALNEARRKKEKEKSNGR